MVEGVCMAGGACMLGRVHGREGVWQRGAWQGSYVEGKGHAGACMVVGVCMVVGACVAGGMFGRVGVCTGEIATEAGGMHPTGMHSCCHFDLSFKSFPYVSYYMENVSLSIV